MDTTVDRFSPYFGTNRCDEQPCSSLSLAFRSLAFLTSATVWQTRQRSLAWSLRCAACDKRDLDLVNRTQPETGSATDIGGRREQQDRVAVLTDGASHLVVLGDGAGGHRGGALAAQALIDAAREEFSKRRGAAPAEFLAAVAACGHARINVIGETLGAAPHTTCVLLYVDDATTAWAHVGDSRLYRFHDGQLVERTLDHSMIELLRMQGKIDESEMRGHPEQNRLYAALGGTDAPPVAQGSKRTTPADGFVLASDGLWSHVHETDMEAALCAPDLIAALEGLVAKARSRGGATCDNISVAAIRHRRPGFRRRLATLRTRRITRALRTWLPASGKEAHV